jgi:hypothetical protein
MSNDPRLSILLPLFDHRPGFTATVLHSLNAADPLRRALTPGTDEHEALVERETAMIYSRAEGMLSERESRPIAKSVLAALRDFA